MNPISLPVFPGDRGPAVANLQEALILLFAAGRFTVADGTREAFRQRLAAERRDGVFGEATGDAVARFRRAQGLPRGAHTQDDRTVDGPVAQRLNQMLTDLGAFAEPPAPQGEWPLEGRVEHEDGTPAAGFRVAVFDRDLRRRREPLGDGEQVLTDAAGVFPPVRFRARDFVEGEGRRGPGPDVVLEVAGPNDERPLEVVALYRRARGVRGAAETPVPDPALGFEPAHGEEVRIVVRGRPHEERHAEYRRLLLDLTLLLVDGLTPADLDQERFRDLDFAVRETGWERALLGTMALAWRLAREARRDDAETAETFYGLLREGPPTSVPPLPATLADVLAHHVHWRRKLDDSLAQRIVGGTADEHVARLRSLRAAAHDAGADLAAGGIAEALIHAGIDAAGRRELLAAYQAHEGTAAEFWRDVVPQRLGWTDGRVHEVQRALHMAELTGHDPRLLARLREGGFVAPRDLARIDRRGWVELVAQVGPPADAPGDALEERIARTADAIAGLVEATFPNEVIAAVAASSRDPELASARDLVARFFAREGEREDGFDIRASPVTTYLETHAERVYDGLGDEDRVRLAAQLKRLQRVYRLGVDREQSVALLELGLDSALHLTRFSPEHFAAEFGERLGGNDRAAMAYGRAESIAGTMLYLFTGFWDGLHAPQPLALRSATDREVIPALKEVPAYRELFGALNLCACSHCQSVYSPAAYFVDLLHMLDRPELKAANPVEALFARRPDLAHIQLTCANTNTRMPYVDLVAEVLESFVANRAPAPFNLPPPPPHQRLPSPAAEELRVNPVPLTEAAAKFADTAYDTLQQAVFPLALPLNLPLETTRAYLEQLGVERAALMPQVDRDMGLEALMAQAAEVLRLAPEDFEALTGATFGGASTGRPATVPELFGLSEADTPTDNAKTLFNHVAPELAVDPTAPDRRATLIRSVQNILGLVSGVSVAVTGRYDAATAAAVDAYRSKKGLPVTGRTDDAFWGALEAGGMPPLSAMVCPVPMFLDRTGLTYEELVALVTTRHVNPALQGDGDLDYLARLGIPAADVRSWIVAGFPALPAAMTAKLTAALVAPAEFITWVQRRTRAVVLNGSADAPCDLDRTTLMHLDGTLLSPEELVALFAFVRLWRKLGWTLEDMDLAVEPGALQGATAFQTVMLLANLAQLRRPADTPVAELVALYGPIPTHGARPLYDRLFRNRAAQLVDPVLALDRERSELAAVGAAVPPALSDHLPVVAAAFRVSADELAEIRVAAGLDDDPSAPPAAQPTLNLAALSAIHRHVALARRLGLRVHELIALLELTGLDVFERPDRFPRGAALAFAEVVEEVRAAGVKVAELEYLCRDVQQPPAFPGAQRDAWQRTLAALLDGLNALAAEEPPGDDPGGEQLVARLTHLLGGEDARTAADLLLGRDVYSAPLAGLPAGLAFPAALQAKVAYDATRKLLRYRGTMKASERAALLAVAGVPAAVQPAYDRAVKSLDAQPRAFVRRALAPLYPAADAEAKLVDVPSLDAAGKPDAKAIGDKLADVLARRRAVLGRSLVRQVLGTDTSLSAELVELLLEDEQVLTSMSGAGPALPDYQELAGDGLSAEYFTNPGLSGLPAVTRTDPALMFDWSGASPAAGVPAVGFSVRWRGQLYVPASGEITLRARCSDGVRVRVDDAVVLDEWRDQALAEFQVALRLEGSRHHALEVEYYNDTGGATLTLSWNSPSIAPAAVPLEALYTDSRLAALLLRLERFYKLARLLAPFALTARELRLLALRGDVVLDQLPLGGAASLPAARATFAQWRALRAFAALRDRYPGSDVSLAEVLKAATRTEAIGLFVRLSGTTPATLETVVDALTVPRFDAVAGTWKTDAPDLSTVEAWSHLDRVLDLVRRTGATPAQLLAWARAREIRQLPTGPETLWFTWTAADADGNDRRAENRELAQEAKDLVRARYDEEQWRATARPLNDALRARRRSSLVAFVLALPEMMRAGVGDSGRLFEFFLLDSEMGPCMETSRIKQGCASVQTYVQRVLLDLESPQVPPARVDRGRWEWMKSYRVWEANRRVLFDTESYLLEPLRDGKTPLFVELESELMQDELDDDTAERAFRHYLEKLDRIAKLVVCGTCTDDATGTLHVFGRTAAAPFAYYHRRLERPRGGAWTEGVWTPWRKVPVDLAAVEDGEDSGVHLLPIVWNRRLYLFWPVFERATQEPETSTLPDGFDPIECWHIRLAWSEYQDDRWTPKQVGLPYLTSRSFVNVKKTPAYPTNEAFKVRFPVNTTWVLPEDVDEDDENADLWKYEVGVPTRLTAAHDPLLEGTVLTQLGDFAEHEHKVDIVNVLALLPKPSAHFLDARVEGASLTINVFCRFKGTPRGMQRKTVTDLVTVVRGGQRSDRREEAREDAAVTDKQETLNRLAGAFRFPACGTAVSLFGGTLDLGYESLERPQDTINAFMALRNDWPRSPGLRLTSGTAPMLGFVPTPFEVLDADNRYGFNRQGPFFYQDQQRCYLVTRERSLPPLTRDSARIRPEGRVIAVERATEFKALAAASASIAAESPARANAWAVSGLARWAAGPGVPNAMRPAAPTAMKSSSMPSFLALATGLKVSEFDQGIADWAYKAPRGEYRFTPHWHPYTCPLLAALNSGGLPALFSLTTQSLSDETPVFGAGGVWLGTKVSFESVYKPDPGIVAKPYPVERMEFDRHGATAIYNWECFFHAPMHVATCLSQAGRHEDAARWFHYVFDPMTADSAPSDRRSWRFLPFRTADLRRLEEQLALLSYSGTDAAKAQQRAELEAAIQEWIANPFRPHVVARRRHSAYMKYVFMKYLDNLIAWADQLFQRDTMESINEAIQLYVLAANLLGPRPQRAPAPGGAAPETYQSLRGKLDVLANAPVDLETRLPFTQLMAPATGAVGVLAALPRTPYFCLPANDRMLAYWDTVSDRLFKIRHCMNLEGTVRQLPLFEPPIDPMLLVEAVAHGLDIGSVLDDLYAHLPRRRFTAVLRQAQVACEDLRQLGGTLLAVLEKRDAEGLARLRAEHETRWLDQVTATRKLQIDESEQSRQALEAAVRMVNGRIQFYESQLAQGLISEEIEQLDQLEESDEWQEKASWAEALAQTLYLFPNITIGGASGGTTTYGGSNVGPAVSAVARRWSFLGASYGSKANRAAITGQHARRSEEWRFQRDLAKRELAQVERQLAAARIRREMARAELRSHETQVENARGVEEMLRGKFSGDELYGWMEGQLRALYFQAYKAAYELARRAERCWQYERGGSATFVKFGAWDSAKRGLLAGERLQAQLQQMERAYHDHPARELQLTKHVSLAQLDPLALIQLKETGRCEVEVPEWLFDLDYPGHCFRRLRSVSLSVPAVVGPYTSLGVTLTLLSSKVRESSRVAGSYDDEDNFRADHLPVEAIAVSSGRDDSGRFELDFHDDRYQPFEHAGAISRWRIELPRGIRSYDSDVIPDVVLHLKLTARRDETLAAAATTALRTRLGAAAGGALFRLISLRHEFPNEWQQLRSSPARTATLTLAKNRFPHLVQEGTLTVEALHHVLILKSMAPSVSYRLVLAPTGAAAVALDWPGQPGRYRRGGMDVTIPIASLPEQGGWQIQLTAPTSAADIERIQDIVLVVRYAVVLPS